MLKLISRSILVSSLWATIAVIPLWATQPVQSKFNWPSPSKIKVIEDAVKNGNKAKMAYVIDVSPSGEGGHLVKLTDFAFLELNGAPLTPELEAALKPAFEAFKSLPTFVVGQDGRLRDIAGMEQTLQATEKMFEEMRKDKSASEAMKNLQKNDAAKELLKRALAEYWTCWVEAWIDFPIPSGQEKLSEFEEPLLPGQGPVKFSRAFAHLGPVPNQPTLVHLRTETSSEDPRFIQGLSGMLRQFTPDTKEDALPPIAFQTSLEAKTNPVNLRPVWAKRTKTLKPRGETPGFPAQNESHEYTFTWE